MNKLIRRLLIIVATTTLSLPAFADQTWLGGTDNLWTTTANWSGNALPGAGDFVIYNNLSTGNLSNWLGGDFTVGSVVVTNSLASPVSISSDVNTLTINASTGTGINMTNATQPLTISANVALGANQSWVVASNDSLTVNGVVSGGFTLYKDGFGSLYLNGANTFTGNFTNNGGPVWINNSAGLGVGGKTIYIGNNNVGAGLHLNGTNGNIIFPNNVLFTVSDDKGTIINEAGDNVINGQMYEFSGGGQAYLVVNAGTLTLNGPIGLSTSARPFEFGGPGNGFDYGGITGTGIALRKVDAGTWTFGANNTFTNITTVEGGTLALTGGGTLVNTPSINVFSNATFDVSALGNFSLSGSITQTLMGEGAINGNISCSGSDVIMGGSNNAPGTLTFSNNLSLNGSSTLQFNLGTATTTGGGTNSLINVLGNLDPQSVSIQIFPVAPLTTPGSYVLMNYGSESSLFGSSITAPGTRYLFSLYDTGSQIGVNVSGGPANVLWYGANSGGAWDVNTSLNWNSGAQTYYNGDNVTFDDTAATGAVVLNSTVLPGSVLFTNSTLAYTLSGTGKISGNVGLTKTGTNTLTISSATHNYTGPVVVNGGTLAVSSVALNGSASTLGAGTNITLNGGTFQFGGARPAATTFNRFWTLGSNGGTVLSVNGVFFIPNQISGPGSFTKSGAVQIILGDIVSGVLTNANNTYTGNTYITQGELQIRNANALGTGKAVVTAGADLAVGGGGNYGLLTNNIDLNGDGPSLAGALEANDAGTQVNFGGTINLVTTATVGVFGSASGFTISGPIIGSGGLKKGSHVACTIILTCPTNTYSGGTSNTGGILQLGSGTTCGSLGSGPVTNNGTLAYNHSDNATNNSAISGTGNLTHTGSGTLTLGGINTYSGTTAVNGGTLLVNGSLGANTVTVANTATLGGYGVIGGAVTEQSGGSIALGASIGTLTISNTLTLAGTTTMKVSHAANDAISGLTTANFGGALNITVVGSVQSGDIFHLFNASTYSGVFAATNLPSLGGGLTWDTSSLASGILKVSGGSPPPASFVVAPFKLSDGTYQLKFSGTSGNYRLWATTNVGLTPVTNAWTLLTSGTFSGGNVTYTDSQATNYPKRFYVITEP